MQHVAKDGFTIDAFVGYGMGYRNVNIDPSSMGDFSSINSNHFSQTFRFGLNLGYSFSFDTTK
jgi:hypothetical protein